AADGVGDLDPTAVVERDRQRHALVVAGELLGDLPLAKHRARHAPVATPEEPHPHAHLVELLPPAPEQPAVEPHEEAHLALRAVPVLGRERVHREPPQADLDAALHGVDVRRDPVRVDVRQVAAHGTRLLARIGRLFIRRSRWYSANPNRSGLASLRIWGSGAEAPAFRRSLPASPARYARASAETGPASSSAHEAQTAPPWPLENRLGSGRPHTA